MDRTCITVGLLPCPFLLVRVGYILIVVGWITEGSSLWDRAMDNFFLISGGVVVLFMVFFYFFLFSDGRVIKRDKERERES